MKKKMLEYIERKGEGYWPTWPKWNLNDFCDRKKFYGKAKVKKLGDPDGVALVSYGTIVAFVQGNRLYRTWQGWSMTTGRHIKAFGQLMGFGYIIKSDWDKVQTKFLPGNLYDGQENKRPR